MLRNYPWFSLREIRPVFNWDKRRFVIYNEYINYRILDYFYLARTWDEWSCWSGIVSLSHVHVACTALKQICKQTPLYFLSWSIDLGKIDPIKLSKCTHAYSQHLCCSVNYRVCSELLWGHLWIGVKLMNFFSATRCSTGTPLMKLQ